jgi:GMP synthase (glutamine-hydrolysing)
MSTGLLRFRLPVAISQPASIWISEHEESTRYAPMSGDGMPDTLDCVSSRSAVARVIVMRHDTGKRRGGTVRQPTPRTSGPGSSGPDLGCHARRLVRDHQNGAMGQHRVAFLRHGPLEVPGVLGARAAELEFEIQEFRVDCVGAPLPAPEEFAGVVVMGSIESANDTQLEWVAQERALIEAAIAHNVPVFGVCFGGQLLAQALGGRVITSPEPEVGWRSIRTDDPSLVPEGPWLLWHEEAVVPPPGAVVVARTDVAVQAYVQGPHIGVQFHPEVTAALIASWIDEAQQRGDLTSGQRRALWDDIERRATTSARNARRLFDGFLRQAGLLAAPS